jgi:threonine dehydrogenase-like Zn-dependent dehydrogenase
MQAAIFEGPGKLTIKDNHPKPSITKPDQALIRVTGVGICGTIFTFCKSRRSIRPGPESCWGMSLPG